MKNKLKFVSMILVFLFSSVTGVSGSEVASAQEIIPADRRIDWSYAGIPGGIPERDIKCAIIDSDIYGNGTADATAAIQTALNHCPANQVVYLPAGTYIITKPIYLRNHKTLRGAGPGLTTLKHTGSNRGGIISVQNEVWDALIGSPQTRPISQAVKDTQVITLTNTSGISTGDVLLLNQLNDGELVNPYGTEGKCTYCGLENGDRALGQFVEVTAVAGNQVYLNVPLHWTYDVLLNPLAYIVPGSSIPRWSGVEDMTMTQDEATVSYMIFLQGVQYCWIKNVEIENIYVGGLQTYYALQSEFTDNYIHNASNFSDGGGYGIVITMYSSNNRVENNILDTLVGGLDTHGGASGNVIAYNYLHNIIYATPYWLIGSPILNHGAHPKMNLWEGNIGYKLEADFINGSSSHNTIFRSQSKGWQSETITTRNNAIEIAKKNYYYNFIGNILGTPGKSNWYEVLPGQEYDQWRQNVIWALGVDNNVNDPKVASTLLRHGNFDYYTDTVKWDPNISNHDLPASLYLSQAPGWWCRETPWPAIGPDLKPMVNKIPAERRFEGLPCLRRDALTFSGIPLNGAILLRWKVKGTLPLNTTWTIDYSGIPGDQPSPITGIPLDARSFNLSGLTNYSWYKITLTTEPSWLSDTVSQMPTDHLGYLPIIEKFTLLR